VKEGGEYGVGEGRGMARGGSKDRRIWGEWVDGCGMEKWVIQM